MEIYECKLCYFVTTKKCNYEKHIKTNKHITKLSLQNNTLSKPTPKIKEIKRECNYCKKIYASRHTLYVHLKKCKEKHKETTEKKSSNEQIFAVETIKQILQNKEIISEILKSVVVSTDANIIMQNNIQNNIQNNGCMQTNIQNNGCTTNNIQNNNFNLGFFLNNQCKDAMNISDFVDNLQITNNDLESIGRNGFVNGITDIIQRELEACGVYKRPLHCTDTKREIIHVKENGKWIKDSNGNPILKNSIEKIGDKCFYSVGTWMKDNPNCTILDTNDYNLWLKISKNVSNSSQEDELKKYNKVIRNIALLNTIADYKKSIMDC